MQQTCHLDDQQRWEDHMLRAEFQQWIVSRAAAQSITTRVLPIGEACPLQSASALTRRSSAEPLIWRHPGGSRFHLDVGATVGAAQVPLPASGVHVARDP